jgi:hypothetical protein
VLARLRRVATIVAIGFPALIPLLVYGDWIVARFELGRWPRLALDDPKHVGTLTPIVHAVSVWGVLRGFYVFCGALVVLLIALLVPKQPNRVQLALRLGFSLLSVGALYVWARLDPGRVFEWYVD